MLYHYSSSALAGGVRGPHIIIYIAIYIYIYIYASSLSLPILTIPKSLPFTFLRAGVFLEMARVEEFVGNNAAAQRILDAALGSRECKRDWKLSLER